jgi:hypothetical protein
MKIKSPTVIATLLAVAFVLAGIVYVYANLDLLSSPLFTMASTIVSGVVLTIVVNTVFEREFPPIKSIKYILPFLILFLAASIGLTATGKVDRASGIPTEQLITAEGFIPDPGAYIAYHAQVKTSVNKILLDDATVSFIYANQSLPSWVVIGGTTQDPIGWVKAHPDTSSAVIDKVLKTRRVL